MDVLTQAYAHLEFDSKLKSAEKMSWIDNTSLATNMAISEPATLPPDFKMISQEVYALPNFMHSLLVSGITPEIIQAWLKQADFTSDMNLDESFRKFQSVSLV